MSGKFVSMLRSKINVLRKPYIQQRIRVNTQIKLDDEKEPLYDKAYTEEYKVSIFDLLAVTVVVTATLSLICDILGFLRRLFR